MLWASLIILFVVMAIAIFAFASAFTGGDERARMLRDRLTTLERAAERNPSEEIAVLRDELLSDIPAFNRMLTAWPRATAIQRVLTQADIKIRAGKFILICAAAAAITGSLLMLLTNSVIFAILGAAAGVMVPILYVSIRRNKRFAKFEEKFPEAIELLVRATRAGHPFATAVELIANEAPEPIAGEFRKVFEEQKFGMPIRDAMLNLAERMPLVDVKFFVTTVMLQRESGGNLAEILEKLAYVIRERFKIRRQIRVYTAQGRLTMMILMALPPFMVLWLSITSPEFIKPLFYDPLGHLLILAGVIMQTIGYLLIRKIINIKV
jgi:tight adherence protein B